MKKIFTLTITFLSFFVNCVLFAQDAAYTMTASTKTITSCRSSLDMEKACTSAGKLVYCANLDRSYTFISGSGTILNANLTFHILDDDFIYVYDGPSSASPLIATWTGGSTTNCFNGLNATSTGSVLTIRFVSNATKGIFYTASGGGYYSGWSLLVGCPPSNCNGNIPANDSCKKAPVICNLNGYCGNTSGWYNEDNPQLELQLAPGFTGSIENNSWVNFYAGATTTTLTVVSANCLTATRGIQGAVYLSNDCSVFTPITGGNFSQTLGPGTVTLSLSGLTVGQSYFLMLDGYNGNVCDYTVTASGNIQTLGVTSSVNSNTICPNQTFTVTATSGAASYAWSPAPLSTSSNTAVYNNISSTSVISTTALGYCGSTATVALTMSVVAVAVSVNSPTICSGTSTILTASGATSYTWNTGATTASISVNPASTTIYTVTGTSGICTNNKTSTVTVNPTPTVVVTNTSICNGSSVTLSASGATTYSWNTGATTSSITVSPASSTVYTVTGTTNACVNTQTVSVSVNPIPTTTASTTGTLTCSSLSVTLNSTLAGVNYTWTAPSGGSVATANAQNTSASGAPGTYTLFVQSAAGCSYSTTTSVTQNTTVPSSVSAGPNQTLTCSSASVTLTGSVGTPTNATVLWTGANVCGTPTNYTTSACGAGVYTLTATNPSNGCKATSTVQVFGSAGAPIVINNPVTNSITCTNTVVTVSITTASFPVSYQWSGIGIVGTTTLSSISVTQGGTFNYTVTNTASGCTTQNNQVVIQNTTIPTTTASVTGTITCTTSTVNLNSTLGSMNYTWTAPAGSSVSSGVNSQNAVGSGPGTYSLLVIDPSNGCSFNTTTTASQNTAIPTTTASVTGTITCSTPTVNLNSTLGSMNYTWTAPAGSSVLSGTNTQNAIGAGAGNYSLTVVNPSNGCTYTTAVTATQDIAVPTLTLSPMTYTLPCSSFTVQLTATTTNTNVSYSWTTNGSLSNTTIANPIATGSGTYNVIVTNTVNGCQTSKTATISPSAGAPTLSISSTSLVLDCNNTSKSVTVTSMPNANVIYHWNVTPFSASTDSSQATFNSPNTYICTVTNTVTNCSTPIQVVVTSNTVVPTIQISNPQVLTCSNPSVTISTTVSPSCTYAWAMNGNPFIQSTGTFTTNTAGIYNVTVTATNGCTNSATTSVTSNTNVPVATINATSTNSTINCLFPTVTLSVSVNPTASYSYTWSTLGNNSTITASIAGVYSVVVTNTSTGCSAFAQYTVSSNTVVPNISATNTIIPCGSNSVNIVSTSSSTNTISYSWSTSNGTIITNNVSTAVVGSAGIYTVTATDATNGCTNTATASVIQNGINAVFSANPTSGTAPLLVNFTNQSTGATSYAWTFGDLTNNTSTATNPNHTYNTTGTHVVTLVASNGLCNATATISIEVFENATLIIPNVFTPNGDGINDIFKITSTGIKDLTCDIFNRWGTRLYTINSVNDSWNGSNNPDGTYFFVLKATGFDGKEFSEKGFLNIFR